MYVSQQQRRDTAANWTANNPVLLDGEIGIETDTDKAKVGDGTSTWTGLSYWQPAGIVPGSGTVTNVSVASANGFAGTVANPSSTPAVTVETTVTGLLKGNGTGVSAATAGTDYLTPSGSGASLTGITATQVGADASGAASTAQTNAESFATSAVATETTRAETAEALLAPKASPGLTGVPTAPTATGGTNTTQIATTAFVENAISGSGAVASVFGRTGIVTAQTGDYTAAQVGADASGAAATAQSNAESYADTNKLAKSANLSDVANAVTAFDNISPLTTLGDLLYEDATPEATRLAGNTTATKKFLTQTGTGSVSAAPAWGTIATGDVPTLNQNTTGTAANITDTLDQVPAPVANVSLNSHKIIGLANGTVGTDAAAFGQIPTTLPPNGSASGDLSGTYPGPTVAKVNGASIPLTKTIVGTNGSGQIIDASSATLTNNTSGNAATATNLAGGATFPAYIAPTVATLSDGSSVALNAALGNDFRWSLGGSSHTLATPSNPVNGQSITIAIKYTGSFTPLFTSAVYDFGAAGQPSWSATSGKTDYAGFRYDSALNAGAGAWAYMGSVLGLTS